MVAVGLLYNQPRAIQQALKVSSRVLGAVNRVVAKSEAVKKRPGILVPGETIGKVVDPKPSTWPQDTLQLSDRAHLVAAELVDVFKDAATEDQIECLGLVWEPHRISPEGESHARNVLQQRGRRGAAEIANRRVVSVNGETVTGEEV